MSGQRGHVPPCRFRLDFISRLSRPSLPANLPSLCGRWHRSKRRRAHLDGLFILRLQPPILHESLRLAGETCNYLLNAAKTPGGRRGGGATERQTRQRESGPLEQMAVVLSSMPFQVKQ